MDLAIPARRVHLAEPARMMSAILCSRIVLEHSEELNEFRTHAIQLQLMLSTWNMSF